MVTTESLFLLLGELPETVPLFLEMTVLLLAILVLALVRQCFRHQPFPWRHVVYFVAPTLAPAFFLWLGASIMHLDPMKEALTWPELSIFVVLVIAICNGAGGLLRMPVWQPAFAALFALQVWLCGPPRGLPTFRYAGTISATVPRSSL